VGHIVELIRRAATAPTPTMRPTNTSGSVRAVRQSEGSGGRRDLHPDTSENGWFVCPTTSPSTRRALWVATDGANDFDLPDGVYGIDTEVRRAAAKLLFTCPHGAEATGPCFTPDGKTLFLSVQHPAEDAETLDKVETLWRTLDGQPPRPSSWQSAVPTASRSGVGSNDRPQRGLRLLPWCGRRQNVTNARPQITRKSPTVSAGLLVSSAKAMAWPAPLPSAS